MKKAKNDNDEESSVYESDHSGKKHIDKDERHNSHTGAKSHDEKNASEKTHKGEDDLKKTSNANSAEDMHEDGDKTADKRDTQLLELSDKFMRLAAEYDNFRRRTQKEKEALYNDAIAAVAIPWLSVIDNLERALAVAGNYNTDEARKIIEGLEMVLAQAKDAISSLGISEIDALSQTFDPNKMEAVMHVEDEDAGESEVLEVLKRGYEKGDKILRHAVVKVAN